MVGEHDGSFEAQPSYLRTTMGQSLSESLSTFKMSIPRGIGPFIGGVPTYPPLAWGKILLVLIWRGSVLVYMVAPSLGYCYCLGKRQYFSYMLVNTNKGYCLGTNLMYVVLLWFFLHLPLCSKSLHNRWYDRHPLEINYLHANSLCAKHSSITQPKTLIYIDSSFIGLPTTIGTFHLHFL